MKTTFRTEHPLYSAPYMFFPCSPNRILILGAQPVISNMWQFRFNNNWIYLCVGHMLLRPSRVWQPYRYRGNQRWLTWFCSFTHNQSTINWPSRQIQIMPSIYRLLWILTYSLKLTLSCTHFRISERSLSNRNYQYTN